MASKTLDEIRKTEAESVNRQKMAKNSAEQAIKKANANAEQMLKSAQDEAKAKAMQMREETVGECEKQFADNLLEADKLCDSLVATANGNRDKVIDMVIETIISG